MPAEGWYHPAAVTRILIACDFDGTITRHDTLHLIVNRFGDPAMWDTLEGPLRRVEITVEEAMQREFDSVRASTDAVLDHLSTAAGIRDGFPEFVRWAEDGGHRLVVTSNGFRVVIDHLLTEAGLAHLPVHSNMAEFSTDGARLSWSDRGDRCTHCDRPCKRALVAALRDAETDAVVLIGDGISDRCAAGVADLVFARAHLAEFLTDDGIPFEPFEDFHTVRRRVESWLVEGA